MAAVLDTHAGIWYVFSPNKLSNAALRFVRQSVKQGKPLYISAISLIETIYLAESGRVPLEALSRLSLALKDSLSGVLVVPVDMELAETIHRISRSLVPDMPDRIIGATALNLNVPLITRDARLQAAGIPTIW